MDNSQSSFVSDDQVEMRFGRKKTKPYTTAINLDAVAHEYMHSVEHKYNGMIYLSESGAIMEGLSDIFGELVERWYEEKYPKN